MAENSGTGTGDASGPIKFCIEYMVVGYCSCVPPLNCQYKHVHRQHVQVVAVKTSEGYVEGHFSFIPLCRFHQEGKCLYGDQCRFRHEPTITFNNATIPATPSGGTTEQTLRNIQEKTCGICFEIVMEKAEGDKRFGILPNCTHCYCLACIYKWRQSHQFEHNVTKSCPECRVTSDFIYPSLIWVENKDEKQCLINAYKLSLKTKDCKYFNNGIGKCPFGNKCFYKHAFPDGRICDVGPPRKRRNGVNNGGPSNQQQNRPFRISRTDYEYLHHIILWDVLNDVDDDENDLDDDDVDDDISELADDFDFLGTASSIWSDDSDYAEN